MTEGDNSLQDHKLSVPLTPTERTRQHFEEQTVEELTADFLSGRPISVPGTDIVIHIDQAQVYTEVGPNYIKGKDGVNIYIPAGHVWAFNIPRAHMNQALVTALHEGKPGACVRLLRASRYDKESNEFIPMTREGDIAKTLGLVENDVASLQFGEDINDPTLYVIRSEHQRSAPISTDEANSYIAGLTNI